ncbi:Dynamin-binding protein [Aphelenchoides fujianensis]|nr:Dynamin-binding protein [Aphelenchoides fujianensis]
MAAATTPRSAPFYARVQHDALPSAHAHRFFEDEVVIAHPQGDENFHAEKMDGQLVHDVPKAAISARLQLPADKTAVVSIAPYDGSATPGDLLFGMHALIAVEERVDDAWARGQVIGDNGRSLGAVGLFPLNFTFQLPALETFSSTTAIDADALNGRTAEVVADLDAKLDGEISLRKGQRVVIEKTGVDWCEVRTVDGELRGSCPRSFLNVLEQTEEPKADEQPAANGAEQPTFPHCRALYDFHAEYAGELPFREGQTVRLLRKLNADWFEGEVEVEGQEALRGVFPSNHVQIVVDVEAEAAEHDATAEEIQSARFGTDVAVEEPPTIGYATVVYDFTSRFPDEMSAEAGFSVRVLRVDGEWATCWNPTDGRTGLIPVGFLQVFLDDDDEDGSGNGTLANGTIGGNASTYSQWYQEPPADTSPSPFNDAWQQSAASAPIYDTVPPLGPADFPQHDSGNASLASSAASSIASRSTAVGGGAAAANPLDDFNELFGLTPQKTPTPAQSAPARPPPPTFPPTPRMDRVPFGDPPIDPFLIPGTPLQLSTPSASSNWEQQFAKVVEELLNSEISYSLELTAWEKAIRDSPTLNQHRKCILTNGYPMLKDLSQQLCRRMAEQMDRPPEQQCYGQVFMELREKITKCYAYYFRCVEEISQIIENRKDTTLQQSLQECLAQMRALGVFVFDVPTAVSRPIQRVLKYPLFIAELSKILPLTHPDHPKLLEANKQMGALVTKMNESKRRKELMVKYRDDKNTSFINRLSKLNMHSFTKKSNRLKFRIAASMGMTAKPEPEFTAMVQELDQAERRLCKLLYDLQVYKTRISFMVEKYVATHTADGRRIPNKDEPFRFEFNCYLKRLEPLAKDYRRQLHTEVVLPCQQLQKSEYAKLIEKRCDKLADWNAARFAKNRNADDIEKARCEFEALNTHVKNNLPKIWSTINERVYAMARLVCELDEAFFQRVNAHILDLPEQLRMFPLADFSEFGDPFARRLDCIHKHIQRVDGKPADKKTRASLRKAFQSKRGSGGPNPAFPTIAPRAQTERERDALIKIFRAENRTPDLRRVKQEYTTPRIVLRKNDVVVVLSFANGYCMCENGVGKERVPMHMLGPFDELYSPIPAATTPTNGAAPLIPRDLVESTTTKPTAAPAPTPAFSSSKPSRLVKQESQNLIDLSSSTPTSSPRPHVPPLQLIDYEREPRSPQSAAAPFEPPASWSTFSPTERKAPLKVEADESEDPFAELFRTSLAATVDPAESARSPRFRTETPPTIPVRSELNRTPLPAPVENFASSTPSTARTPRTDRSAIYETPPVLPQRPKETKAAADAASVQPTRRAPPPPEPKRPTSLDNLEKKPEITYVAEFDFSPVSGDSNQLMLRENDRVHVLQRHDEAGNPEWFLVRESKPPNRRGYVPSAYLRPELTA